MTIKSSFEAERLAPPREGELQVCFATDGGYAPRVEVAAYSLLKHASCPVRIILIGTDDVADSFGRLERIVAAHDTARLEYIFPEFLRQAVPLHTHAYLPLPAVGRMLIPHLLSGRVFYIDGDTLVRKDMARVLSMDLQGNLAAAAIDQIARRSHWRELLYADASDKRRQEEARIATHDLDRMRVHGVDTTQYYNSGVMIIDCDAIQKDPTLMNDMLDVQRAQAFPTFDQDLVNLLFEGRLLTLPPEWNVWQAISRTARAPFPPEEQAHFATSRTDPLILHFCGQPKPWARLQAKHFQRGFRWHKAYWSVERELRRAFGESEHKARN